MQPEQFLTRSLQDLRIARVLNAAIEAVNPSALVAETLQSLRLPPHRRLFLLGLGKAAEAMTRSAAAALENVAASLVITKHRIGRDGPRFRLLETGHPVPDHRSLAAGRAAIRFVAQAHDDDLLICLISGGGSALATCPVPDVTLEDLQAITTSALASGATIEDINVIRRQLDQVKGGGLAIATGAPIISLILSDVIGDRLEAIASGPTVPNPTGPKEAIGLLRKYGIGIPPRVERAIGTKHHTAGRLHFDQVRNIIIGNNLLALKGAARAAANEAFSVALLGSDIRGEAREVGQSLAGTLADASHRKARPFCLVAGGEATVTLASHGTGGRNQELALAAVDILDGIHDCMLIALASDGDDGLTDAAGAVVTGATRGRAADHGLIAADHLDRHDAYLFFEALGDLLKPGYTGTNVNDLVLLFGL